MQTIRKVAVTGGMGSGKTTVCRIFESLGVPVYNADQRAKWLMTQQETLKSGIINLLGTDAYEASGQLNRKWIAKIVFQQAEKLEALNALVHPAVGQDFDLWLNDLSGLEYCIKETALLFETSGHHMVDASVLVYSPKELRIKRILKRDQLSTEAIENRMKRQMPEHQKMELSDHIIYNDEESLLIPQVLELHKKFSNPSEV